MEPPERHGRWLVEFFFGGYMKMQRILGADRRRQCVTMVLALGLGGLAIAGADHLINPPATFKLASADEGPAARVSRPW
jgi:hypothetical protein